MNALLLAAALASADTHTVRQGDTLILKLTEEQCLQDIYAFEHVYRCSEGNRLILGVDLETKPGLYYVGIVGMTGLTVEVEHRGFPTKPRRKRPGRRIDKEKRAEEVALMVTAFASGPRKYPNWPAGIEFREPLSSWEENPLVVTDVFGWRRYYRKSPKNATAVPHRGDDFRAKYGTPVLATSYGVVMLAHTFVEGNEGNMVVLYHGDGIYSLYLHLGKFNCIPGQVVRGGDVIAYSGDSGVEGQPHLHFAVKVNGSNIEPLEFIEKYNAYLEELANE